MTGVLPLGTPLRHRYGRNRVATVPAPAAGSSTDPVFDRAENEVPFLAEWSRGAARIFLDWLAAPSGGRWLDAGCGYGALTQTILESTAPIEVFGVDPSIADVAAAEAHVPDFRAHFALGNVGHLGFSDDRFDTVVSGLSIGSLADPEQAAREMARVTRDRGLVGAYVWDFDDGMQIVRAFWDAAVTLDPAALIADRGPLEPAYRPGRLAQLFHDAQLHDVEARALYLPTPFRDVDDFWRSLLEEQGPAARYLLSLSNQDRTRLHALLSQTLTTRGGDLAALTARVWAVKGIK